MSRIDAIVMKVPAAMLVPPDLQRLRKLEVTIRYLLPAVIFIAVVAFLADGLTRDPRLVPSPLIGKPAPEFLLPTLQSNEVAISLGDLKGRASLLNVWATWCFACRAEHETLLEIAQTQEAPIYGLNWKDERQAALAWLKQLGDPYTASAYDADGRVGIDFGVYGAPETFVLGPDGTVAYKHVGVMTLELWRDTVLPLIQKLNSET